MPIVVWFKSKRFPAISGEWVAPEDSDGEIFTMLQVTNKGVLHRRHTNFMSAPRREGMTCSSVFPFGRVKHSLTGVSNAQDARGRGVTDPFNL